MQTISNETNYLSAKEVAAQFNITSRRVRVLAAQGRIKGAVLHVKAGWLFHPYCDITPGARGPAFGLKRKLKAVKPQKLSKSIVIDETNAVRRRT